MNVTGAKEKEYGTTTYRKAVEHRTKRLGRSNLDEIVRIITDRLPGSTVEVEIANESFSTKVSAMALYKVLSDRATTKRAIESITVQGNSLDPYRTVRVEINFGLKRMYWWIYATSGGKPSEVIDWGDATVVEIERSRKALLAPPQEEELYIDEGEVGLHWKEEIKTPVSSKWEEVKTPVFIIVTVLTLVGLTIAYLAWRYPK